MSNDIKELLAESLKSVREVDNHTINLIDVSDRSKTADAASIPDKAVMSLFDEPVKAIQSTLEMLSKCPDAAQFAWLFDDIKAKAAAGEPLYAMLMKGKGTGESELV